jgi:flavin-dependent dehydrogenase
VRGHWIPQGLRRRSAVHSRVLLVGDAAATGDPFFGEGISYAMASAELASRAIRAWRDGRIGSLAPYDRLLRRTIGPAMRRLAWVSEVADRLPVASLLALRWSGWVRDEAVEAVAGTGRAFRLPAPTSAGPVASRGVSLR